MALYPMKILLADDHALFRDALTQYLERAYEGVHVMLASDFYQALDVLSADPAYDLVLLDFKMPGMDGLRGLEVLISRYPTLKIALMSGLADPETVAAAMRMGASGYFPKTLSGKGLLDAIAEVMEGKQYVPLDKERRVLPSHYYSYNTDENGAGLNNSGGMQNRGETSMRDGDARSQVKEEPAANPFSGVPLTARDDIRFTPRERQVLQYLMRGLPNKEIANDLGLQLVTVKLHVRGICRKLNVKNRTQAAIRARELGYWDADILRS